MKIKVIPGRLGLRPEDVMCRVLTDDLCVLFVDFSANSYKNVDFLGQSGDNDVVYFGPGEDHNLYLGFDRITDLSGVVIEEWKPQAEKDFSDNFGIAITHWRRNTIFHVVFHRMVGVVPVEVEEDSFED